MAPTGGTSTAPVSGPAFGTSGLRGLVADLGEALVARYVRAFVEACETGGTVYLGQDLRPSSPAIAEWVAGAARDAGCAVVRCGALPTPALAARAMAAGAGAIMVTGSHIPADRNGLKFYTRAGEITKADEARIAAAPTRGPHGRSGPDRTDAGAAEAYAARYRDAFGAEALAGLRIGVWQHSSVARDLLVRILSGLGAVAVPLGRSETFVPVDTEAVGPDTRARLAGWCRAEGLDALVSTDGDGDRPLAADAAGRIVPGDVLGVLTARALGATHVVTTGSANDMVERIGSFARVVRTRIGSPHVIAGIAAARTADPAARVVGYEPNGGFILGTAAGGLEALTTRDAVLPILAPLAAARAAGQSLADLVAALPPVFTATDRIAEVAPARGRALMAALAGEASRILGDIGRVVTEDRTDGVRLTLEGGRVVHVRPSGNAPEMRVYVQAESADAAEALLGQTMARIGAEVAA